MTIKQVETAVVAGTVTGSGNATVTVTAFGMTSSPKAVSVAVTNGDTASIVGGLIRTALAFDTDVSAMFLISGSGANVVLTKHVAAANDSTVNIAIANDTCTGLTAAPTSTNTTAGTGLTNGYVTLAQLKASDILNFTVTTHDALLETIIGAVSRKIDNHCARHFYQITETRYFQAELRRNYRISVDDIATSSGLLLYTDDSADGTYENTWAATDYNLLPINAERKGWPFTSIERTLQGTYAFPHYRSAVKITATFGWAAVPDPVTFACLLQCNREYARTKTPLGQAGAMATGTITLSVPKLDPDVIDLLADYVREED